MPRARSGHSSVEQICGSTMKQPVFSALVISNEQNKDPGFVELQLSLVGERRDKE